MLPPVPLSDFSAEWRLPVMRHVFGRLATRLQVVQLDGRGTGRSQREIADPSFEDALRDVDAVLEQVAPTGSVCLLGFYHSCLTALAWAARHPGRVSRMVLFGGAASGSDTMSAAQTQALLSLIERDWDVFVDSAVVTWMGWGDGELGRLGAEWFRAATTPAVAGATIKAFGGVDMYAELAAIAAPTLVLHRRGSRTIPLSASERLAAGLPNGELRILEGDSETLFFEDPDGVVDALLDFLLPDGTAHPRRSRARRDGHTSIPRHDGLTPREVAVLRLIAAGESNAEIAQQLSVSVHTVERHAVNVYAKIGARGRADATAYALRNRLT